MSIRLGVLADIQYANKPNRYIAHLGRDREFSQALRKTQPAIAHFNATPLDAVLHLGDIIDGNETPPQSLADLHTVLDTLSHLTPPLLHVIGNHCLSVPRPHLLHTLNLTSSYYYNDLSPKWRLVILDTVELSVLRPTSDPEFEQAARWLQDNADEPNAQIWNGGVGAAQIRWLRGVLKDAEQRGMYVIMAGHLPLLPEAAKVTDVVWDAERVLEVVAGGVVKAYFCGHCHGGGYAFRDGVHHVTFEAVVDSGGGAWGVVEVDEGGIVVRGGGGVTSRVLKVE